MKSITCFILLLCICSCNNSKKVEIYKNFCSEVPSDALVYMPLNERIIKESEYLAIYYPYGVESLGFCGILTGKTYSDKDFDKQINLIKNKQKNIGVYTPDSIEKHFFEISKNSDNENAKFLDFKAEDYYLFESRKGIFLPNEHQYYFRKPLNHGLSSGAFTNRKLKKNFLLVFDLVIPALLDVPQGIKKCR